MLPDLTAVTPWLDHPELSDDYWEAISQAGPGLQALVIDNASDPPLPNAHRLEENAGFSRASNVGLRLATTDAVLFLNNDIAATGRDWAQPIREALEPGVLVGCRLRFDEHGDVDGMSLPYLDGWCLAGMTDDLRDLGGFDESFHEPAYYSDNDLCFRARLAGMVLREVPVGLRHKGGQTTQANGYVLPSTKHNRALFENRVRYELATA